ncbi:hypothetical protein GA0074695_3327 [Micromonospora viridifaciens]|uniref:DUF4871 domain-containing protein n=1 Tax=Micromonospora viridifaciens TaxID=1881 RepID=A0A1C4XI78_MICVI|nr:hypothetical protein [Micromonospora viridifaciens]SCF08096.1 hypothetical protein GA0074695_3327 [Micromonospora viridifaciens]
MLLGSAVLAVGCAPTAPYAMPASTDGTSAVAPAATGCASRIETGALPDWADAGFSGDTRVPHVLGAQGEIVAVLFAHPLTWDRKDGVNNKILWVAHPAGPAPDPASPADLMITAALDGTDTRVTREVAGGPGPSIIDLPQAGCWHLALRWSGRTDTMDLVYADGRAAAGGASPGR